MRELFLKGGPWIMGPLLLCSLLSVTVSLERLWWWWRQRRGRDGAAVERMLRLAEEGQYEQAEALAMQTRDPRAAVLASGLANRDHGLTQAMQIAAGELLQQHQRGLSLLDTIITLAPLLGILGTVTGIIRSFNLLGEGPLASPRLVTAGIAEALITTAAGLTVAVLTLLPYNLFMTRLRSETRELEKLGTRLELAHRKGAERSDATAKRR